MASLGTMFQQKNTPPKESPKTSKVQSIHYTKLYTSQYQYREINPEDVEALADLIVADGEVLQPLLVRKNGSDSYEILAGHKRHRACKYLVEERNEDTFAMLPCKVAAMDDTHAEFAVYSTNGYGIKTPYEQMREIEGMMNLMKLHPEKFPNAGSGRTVEKLARQLNISRSVISDYQNISHNLGKKGMDAFQAGTINKSAAVALSRADETTQDEILDQGITQAKDIKQYRVKDEEPASKPEVIPNKAASAEANANCLKEQDLDFYVSEIRNYLDSDTLRRFFDLYYNNCNMQAFVLLLSGKEISTPTCVCILGNERITIDDFGEEEITITYQEFVKTMIRLYDLDSCGLIFNGVAEAGEINFTEHGTCPYCNEKLYFPIHSRFCSYCGKEILWLDSPL